MKISTRKIAPVFVAASASIVAISSVAIAQDGTSTNAPKTVDITALTCQDLLMMDGEDEVSTILFVQGYISGKTAETIIDADEVRASKERRLEQCIGQPNSTVLSVFEQNR